MKYFKLNKKGKAELAKRIQEEHERGTKQRAPYGPGKNPELNTVRSDNVPSEN